MMAKKEKSGMATISNLEDTQAYIPSTPANAIFPEKNPDIPHRGRLMTPHPNTGLRFLAKRRLEY